MYKMFYSEYMTERDYMVDLGIDGYKMDLK
jgi:hypothetical protein